MVVDGNLDQPGLSEFGRRDQGQEQQTPDNQPPIGAQIADKPAQKYSIIGFADYFIFVNTAEMHDITLFPKADLPGLKTWQVSSWSESLAGLHHNLSSSSRRFCSRWIAA